MEREQKTHAPLTGHRYSSVDDFMAGESVSPEVRKMVAKLDTETQVVESLVQSRRDTGLTPQQMAEKLGKTQGAISKLESSNDQDITFKELAEYAGATNVAFALMIGKQPNHIPLVTSGN